MIAVVIASFGREELLRRLLLSLRPCPALADGRLILVNNGPRSLVELTRETGWPDATIISPPQNLGCAGGVARGMEEALGDPRVRHLLVLDDDAMVEPDAPEKLREVLLATGGGLAVPMITNAQGEVAWFPGLRDKTKWRVIKRAGLRPEDYLRECGPEPATFTWSAWPVIMMPRATIERCGLPMQELWYQGVDLEFTMRVTAQLPGYFVPAARARHEPPPIRLDRRFYLRECGGLQNGFYVVLRLPHGRRALRHLPGNVFRFFRGWGCRPRVLADVARAFWWGAVRAKPQGIDGFDHFRRRWAQEPGSA